MFIFYDPSGCKEDVLKLIRVHQANFPIAGQRPMSESELAQNADELLCHYSQAYAKAYMKRQFLLPTRPSEGSFYFTVIKPIPLFQVFLSLDRNIARRIFAFANTLNG